MSLIIFPLSKGPLTLSWVLLLIQKFVENLHCLFIRNDSFTIELVLTISESDKNVDSTFTSGLTLTQVTHHGILLLLKLIDKLVGWSGLYDTGLIL